MESESGTRTRAVVVTGASTGIGRAVALRLCHRGFSVFAGVRKDSDAESLRQESGGRVTPLMLDLTDHASLGAARDEVDRATGGAGIGGLVNNAGIAVAGPLECLPIASFEEQLRVNVVGSLAVTQAFLPLIRRGGGRIITISSDNGKAAWPYLGAYCASKHAIEATFDSLRMELRPWGIEVVLVEPGGIKTAIWDKTRGQSRTFLEGLSAEGRRLYGPVIDRLYKLTDLMERTAIEPEAVAKTVERALTARRPRTRYIVGIDARAQIIAARLLPTRLRDWIINLAIDRLGK